MLNEIFKSKTRTELLKLLFCNPEQKFYLRELARKIGTSAGNIQKEIKKMERDELVEMQKRGNQNLYWVNVDHPLYPELSRIISKTVGIEEELRVAIVEMKWVQFAFVFGSYVNGDFRASSDIDLFLIGNLDKNNLEEYGNFITKISVLEGTLGRVVNWHLSDGVEFLKNLKEKSFYQDIVKKIIMLTANENEFRKFIGRTKEKQKN